MSAIPAEYRLVPNLRFEYDGALDSRNLCPSCGELLWWYDARCEYVECETCRVLCDVATEQVWQVPQDVPRKPEVIVGAMRHQIDVFLRTSGRTHGYGRLDELCSELEAAMRQEVSK